MTPLGSDGELRTDLLAIKKPLDRPRVELIGGKWDVA